MLIWRFGGLSSFGKVNTIKLEPLCLLWQLKWLIFADSPQTQLLRTTRSDDGLGPESEMHVKSNAPGGVFGLRVTYNQLSVTGLATGSVTKSGHLSPSSSQRNFLLLQNELHNPQLNTAIRIFATQSPTLQQILQKITGEILGAEDDFPSQMEKSI